MAALTRHGFLLNSVRNTPAILTTFTATTVRRDILRCKTQWSKSVKVQSFENTSKSLAARGTLDNRFEHLCHVAFKTIKLKGCSMVVSLCKLKHIIPPLSYIMVVRLLESSDIFKNIELRFLRPLKPYEVPGDVSERFIKVCQAEGFSVDDNTTIEDPVSRFKLFVACEKEFKHSLPNSMLADIETIGQLRTFYETPVNTTVPLEALGRMKLPKNLHIEQNYHRFHPETDTMFGGKTAFPKSSTLVTGLTYKKKYPGHIQKTSFP